MKTETYTTKLDGMICPECENEAASALLHTRGVLSASVSYRKACAQIAYDSEITTESEINAALLEAGYPAGGSGKSGIIADAASIVAVILLVWLIPRLTAIVSVPALESGAGYGTVFLIGLLSGVHCIGMCGGIMLAADSAGSRRFISPLLYNLGRIISYTIIGGVFGALGSIISYDAAFRSMLFTLCGALVVVLGLNMWGVPFVRVIMAALRPPRGAAISGVNGKGISPLLVGLMTGLMPCGTMSAVWLLSASAGSAINGACNMLCFALGTVPAMLLFGSLSAFIPRKYNKYILKASTVMIVALGINLLLKGIRLI